MLGYILKIAGTVYFLKDDKVGANQNTAGVRVGYMSGVGRPKRTGLGA